MDEDPKSATEPHSEGTSRPSPSSRVGAGQKHEAPQLPGGSASGSTDTAASQQQSKRRRGLGVVTPNACTECRKKRAKCDGQKPCSRCKSQKDVQCIYEVPVRQSKENLRHEIESLRQQKRQSDSVLEALCRPELWGEVLNKLQNKQSIESISEWLANNPPTPAAVAAGGASGLLMGTFAPPPESRPGVNLPPLATFGGVPANAEGYGGVHTMSPVTAQPLSGIKQDFGTNSPWNFSASQSQSQTVSTRSDSHPDLRQWMAEPHTRVGRWVQDQSATEMSSFSGADQILAPLEDWSDMKLPPNTWTTVTSDVNLVRHLLALYFCWEYPTFASLSKEHFLRDFNAGRHRYCSPILVNALLALGCRFSEQPKTRTDPNDPHTSGDHFFKEALRLLSRQTSHHNLTTIQALGIMSIREASCGRDSESWYYAGQSIRLTTEMGLHRLAGDGDADELAVQAATFWGAFALDHAWSLATGSLPQCSAFPQLPPKPAIIDDIEASLWIPYTDDGAPLARSCEQPSNVRSVYKCFCELSELVHKSLYVLHSPVQPVTSRDLLYIYHEYLNWYDRIPEVLRLGHNFTPAVLFAHMYYHFAILLLFRPLIKLRIIGSYVLPRDVCTQAADAIQGLLRSYAQLYTLKRTPSFVPYFVLTSTIMHLASGEAGRSGSTTSPAAESSSSTVKAEGGRARHGDAEMSSGANEPERTSPSRTPASKLNSRAAEALNQGIADLAEMAPCHHFAKQALSILRYLAKKWNVAVDIPRTNPTVTDDDEDTVQTATSSLNFFVPNVDESDFICNWDPGQPGRPADAGHHQPSQQQHQQQNQQMPQEENVDSRMGGMEVIEDIKGGQSDPQASEQMGWGGPVAQNVRGFENPLFWTFPMQGRPMLPVGPLLTKAGFEPL
ncbi:hypothetical protein DL764_000388 [Monosporascus ibericus]|uniref:Zn(2)-C6 fungal-type domain-containing protein n=1 Tax=Monosporascus ibericus TaxID=155417 RepID=A0A4Q4TTK7_9PEZI|nr:hypothetical protein DL764_000388 [Monosporascus ibericus]